MNGPRFSPGVFLVAFCGAYAVFLALDLPLFRYYPLNGDFSWWTTVLEDAGPGMAWYGLLANGAIVAAVAAVVVPGRLAEPVLRGRFWLFPMALMLFTAYLMRQFFVA